MNEQLELFPGGLCWGNPKAMEKKYQSILEGEDDDFTVVKELMGDALTDEEKEYL